MTTLTADSGSTKTTWLLHVDSPSDNNVGSHTDSYFITQGINPFHMSEDTMRSIILYELLPQNPLLPHCSVINFYGAGCTKEKSPLLHAILQQLFPEAEAVTVDSDMLGAAKSLFGNSEGIACILGTGANSCLYDGSQIVSNVSPMGYILGDEGSGAVLGKTFINLLYKGPHDAFIPLFEQATGLTPTAIIQRVYRESLPNRFLASLCPFIKEHIHEAWIEEMVVECFRLFFRNNVAHYHRPTLPCSFVGSIAFHFEAQLRKAALQEGYVIGEIKKEPL